MSNALIIYSSELSGVDIFGFTYCAPNTIWKIYYQDGSGLDIVYTDKDNNGVFVEDFPNKRVYLEFLKENKKRYNSFGYRITKEQLWEIFLKLKKDFLIYIGSADDLETFQDSPKRQIMFSNINEKTIFREKIIYKVCNQ